MLEMTRGVETIHNFKEKIVFNKYEPDFYVLLNIAHNDIKPRNFMLSVTRPQRIKLIDMGLIRKSSEYAREGTVLYMPPEKLCKKFYTISPANDIWSLGISFGSLLFHGDEWPELQFKSRKDEYNYNCQKFLTNLIANFNEKYKSLYTSNKKYGSADKGALEKLGELISGSMLRETASDRADITKIAKELENIIAELNKDSLYLSTNDKKLMESKAFFYDSSKKPWRIFKLLSSNVQTGSQFEKIRGEVQPSEKLEKILLI